MSDISRRAVAKGAAWSIPAVTVAGAAPSMAVSCAGQKTTVKKYTYSPNTFNVDGIHGALNTSSFWVTVTQNVDTSATDPCVTFVDNTDETASMKVVNQRVAGSTGTRVRSISLTQANPNYTSVTKTLDSAGRTHPLGASDYEWVITFQPSKVYTMADHRFYVTMSNGDGGLIDGRIKNNLVIDGVVEIAEF